MKKTVLFLSFLLSCIFSMAGNMDNYTFNPVSGSSLTQEELKNVSITFPNADGVRASDFRVYVYDTPERKGAYWTYIDITPGTNGQFSGNTITMDLSALCQECHGNLYFTIDTYQLKSESYDYAPVIEWMYTIPSPFNGMVSTPVDGATVAPGDFNKLTLTFPNITDLKLNEFRGYCGFELRTVEGDQWVGNGNLKDLSTIEGNTLSLDIKQEWKPAQSGKIKVSISKKALVDGATNIESNAITLIYDIATKQYEYTVTPSNAEALPITAFHDLTFTFKDAQKVELPADITSYDARKVHLRRYTRDGYEEYGFYNADDVTIEGNVVKIYMRVTAVKGGQLTLIADEGAFILDGNPSQEIRMEYEFLPFETTFDVKCEETLDSKGRLNIILPSDLKLEYATAPGFTYLKKANGFPTDYMVFADYSKENNTAWFTFEESGGDILPDGEYYFRLKSEAIVMFSEDGIMVSSRGGDISFKKSSTSGIHDVRIVADGKAFTLDGRPAALNAKGIVIKDGKKVVR